MSSRREEEVEMWRLPARQLGVERLNNLVRRGLVGSPVGSRLPRRARVEAAGSVSGLVAEQRR
jgi:hypothetical protein